MSTNRATQPFNCLRILKIVNPNRTFTASYDQTLYEKNYSSSSCARSGCMQLVSADSDRNSDFQPDRTDGSSSRDSGNLNSGARSTAALMRPLVPSAISPTEFTGS